MNISASRVNGELLQSYAGKRVCVVGRVLSQEGQVATIQSSDSKTIEVKRNPGANYGSQFVEVVGIADASGGLSISEERACDFGDDFDLGNYDALVQMVNGKFKNLFSE